MIICTTIELGALGLDSSIRLLVVWTQAVSAERALEVVGRGAGFGLVRDGDMMQQGMADDVWSGPCAEAEHGMGGVAVEADASTTALAGAASSARGAGTSQILVPAFACVCGTCSRHACELSCQGLCVGCVWECRGSGSWKGCNHCHSAAYRAHCALMLYGLCIEMMKLYLRRRASSKACTWDIKSATILKHGG